MRRLSASRSVCPPCREKTGFTTLERRWARPTCDVNGMYSGYQGEGPKTIVPAEATAKITCRLVPGQNPDAHRQAASRRSSKSDVRRACGWSSRPTTEHRRSSATRPVPYMAAARTAIEAGFGQPPVLIREGGSIPVVASFKELLGVDTLLLGWGRNSDNLHSPNEHFHLDDFHHGTQASAALWAA